MDYSSSRALSVSFKLDALDGTVLGVVFMNAQDADMLNRGGRVDKITTPRQLLSVSPIAVVSYHRFILEKSRSRIDAVTLIGIDPEMLDEVPEFAFVPGAGFAGWTARRDAGRTKIDTDKPVDSGPYLRAARDLA